MQPRTQPNWTEAAWLLNAAVALPGNAPEAGFTAHIFIALRHLFPALPYPEIAIEYHQKSGRPDITCGSTAIEVKSPVRLQQHSNFEYPLAQATRYASHHPQPRQPAMFDNPYSDVVHGPPQAILTDATRWLLIPNPTQPDQNLQVLIVRPHPKPGNAIEVLCQLRHFLTYQAAPR